MDFFFVDDAGQQKPTRTGMGPILAVGGLYVPEVSIQRLEKSIEKTCSDFGFPPNEMFKWSPGKELWMYSKLIDASRQQFFMNVMKQALECECKAIIILEDTRYKTATGAPTPEIDLIQLFLERAHWVLFGKQCCGIVIVSQPGGDRRHENKFLADCVETLRLGTDYVKLDRIALSVLSCSPKFIRLLQLADVITSCTTAYVAGENKFSPPVFDAIRPILAGSQERKGGFGLKIHPDIEYVNLYYWLLGDPTFWKGNMGLPLPLAGRMYATSPDKP